MAQIGLMSLTCRLFASTQLPVICSTGVLVAATVVSSSVFTCCCTSPRIEAAAYRAAASVRATTVRLRPASICTCSQSPSRLRTFIISEVRQQRTCRFFITFSGVNRLDIQRIERTSSLCTGAGAQFIKLFAKTAVISGSWWATFMTTVDAGLIFFRGDFSFAAPLPGSVSRSIARSVGGRNDRSRSYSSSHARPFTLGVRRAFGFKFSGVSIEWAQMSGKDRCWLPAYVLTTCPNIRGYGNRGIPAQNAGSILEMYGLFIFLIQSVFAMAADAKLCRTGQVDTDENTISATPITIRQ